MMHQKKQEVSYQEHFNKDMPCMYHLLNHFSRTTDTNIF